MMFLRPRTRPLGSASHFMNTLTSLSPRSLGCGRSGSSMPLPRIASQMPSASSASFITLCPMRYLPPMPRTLPTTTICARSSSTPEEHEATLE